MNVKARMAGGARRRSANGFRSLRDAMLAAGLSGLMLGSVAATAADSGITGTASALPLLQETPIVFAFVGDFGSASGAENDVAMPVSYTHLTLPTNREV